jgi:alanyl-tRNA synthetase
MADCNSRTVKLYWDDPLLENFRAKVLEVRDLGEDGVGIIVDRTAFYPEGGGQPADEGRLGEAEVFDVQEENGIIIHHTDMVLEVGADVEGSIDWQRRWDIMQQHSGQHLLSRVVLDEFGAVTRGFHLGEDESTIDLSVDLSDEDLLLAQARANSLMDRDLPLSTRFGNREDPAVKAARKPPPPGVEEVRLVDIEGVDSVPCGGTHLPSTSSIGGIHILAGGTGRAHGLFRLSFICGGRLRRRLAFLDQISAELSLKLTTSPDCFPERFEDMEEQIRDLKRETTELRKALIPLRVSALLEGAEQVGTARVVMSRVDDLSPESLPALVSALTIHPDVIALVGADVSGTGRIIFARGEDFDIDMGTILVEAATALGGGGGGTADHATGGGPRGEALDTVLVESLDKIRGLLEDRE